MSNQQTEEDSKLIADLYALSNKQRKLVRATENPAPEDPEIKISSWKMNEFKYYDIPSPFPTLARGLFTQKLESGQYRIVARGYDKFFNIGEVPWNTWPSLEMHTGAPYTLTLKSNGCIIFIGALTESKLLITSKHSIGSTHAKRGEEWLHKHLAAKGKTPEQLAATLWKNNWTAVAELCDDSFEEHVLAYGPDVTGLHLHGLNTNSKHFRTELPAAVDAFAAEWGFIGTKSIVLDSIQAVKEFTEEIGRTGSWNGEPLEGFVVRTHVTQPPMGSDRRSRSPYEPGSSFFFKVKFDEPYMMYRDWREVTKAILAGKEPPKSKMKRPETKTYLKWVREEIKRDPKAFAEYQNNKGIVATRERFLAYLKSTKGESEVEEMTKMMAGTGLQEGAKEKEFGKTIIVPVAIPGSGKTLIAVALADLFGFGHTQSDDVQAKKAAPVFIKNVVNLLKTHDVVIADKNNHLRQHREQLREATQNMQPAVRLLALNWALDQPPAMLHRICGDRVLARGDRHQSLRADTLAKQHEEVIWQFLQNAEELADSEVDASVEMRWEDTPAQALERAVDACVRVLGVARPDAARVQAALERALAYAPETRRPDEKRKRDGKPRYFGLLAEVDVAAVVRAAVEGAEGLKEESRALWTKLVKEERVARRPHVTVVHANSLPKEQELWDRCTALHSAGTPPLFSWRLGHVVWDDRVMALTVEDLAVSRDVPDEEARGVELVVKLPAEVKEALHVTVGTKSKDVSPVEAKELVRRWRKNPQDPFITAVPLNEMWVNGRLKGLNN